MNRNRVIEKFNKYIIELMERTNEHISIQTRKSSGSITVYIKVSPVYRTRFIVDITAFNKDISITESIKVSIESFNTQGNVYLKIISDVNADRDYEIYTRHSQKLGFPHNIMNLEVNILGEMSQIIDIIPSNAAFPILLRNAAGITFASNYDTIRASLDDKYINRMCNLRNILKNR